MTLSIMDLIVTVSKKDTQRNDTQQNEIRRKYLMSLLGVVFYLLLC
jgi:hypothetical protein